MKPARVNSYLRLITLVLAAGWFASAEGLAQGDFNAVQAGTLAPEDLLSLTPTLEPTLVTTEIVTIPLVGQNSAAAAPGETTPVLKLAGISQADAPLQTGPTPTITPTLLPPQTGSYNMPIVFGATAIVGVIVVAWLLVGLRPKKTPNL
jgi:hypothetical protein